MIRLFIAFPLPETVRTYLGDLVDRARGLGGSIKWVKSGDAHLTLKFLGDTDPALVESIKEELNLLAEDFPPIAASTGACGAFPNFKKPRVYWVGLTSTAALAELAAAVDRAMSHLGYELEDRPFTGHLTLGRIKDPRGCEPVSRFLEQVPAEEIPLRFDRLILFRSELTPKGPLYTALHTVRLGIDTFGG